jgi:aminopeptidase N
MRHRTHRSSTIAILALFLAALASRRGSADTYPRQPGVDVANYAFNLVLTDTTDAISGRAVVDVRITTPGLREVRFDLVSASGRTDGKGMTVQAVRVGETPAPFRHEADVLHVDLSAPPVPGSRLRIAVEYGGVPASGLRIGPNRHGERTFFSDNWPDRGRHWLPLVDHPSDKATCEFIVTAPSHYQVVSNGLIVEETDIDGGARRTHWRQSVPIAPWLYVLGVARFAVQHAGDFSGRPIETWVYRQDRDAGFFDFAQPSRQVLEYFSDAIGPYAYEKLANVQSPATGGGMEAASAIMYGQDLVKGDRSERIRNVVIHEIAHQWWGNAVTESDWDDVWLSEGFATYFTLLFREHAYGHDDFIKGLLDARTRVLDFHAKNPGYRIVHDNLADTTKVTTGQVYQLGAWTLHMLRGVMGEEAFWRGVRAYYAEHMNGSATTADFRRAMETASGRDLGVFFTQWLTRGGLPSADVTWSYEPGAVVISVSQTQREDPWVMDLPVEITLPTGAPRREVLALRDRQHTFRFAAEGAPRTVTVDPDHWVLIDARVTQK